MKCRSTGHSDPGLVRTSNQDHFYIDPKGRYFIVADGMGGHAGGEEASQIATQTIQTYLDQHWDISESSQVLLEKAFLQANQAIVQQQFQHPEHADMGTTAVVALFRQNQAWCAHVGDSRLYRLQKKELVQVTEDHTWVARATRAGDLSSEQAKVHPWRHVLSQCLGRKDLRQVDTQQLDLQPGDRLLLCSDGLTEEVADDVIFKYLQFDQPFEGVVDTLINVAKENGGKDNITIVIIEIDE